ncbi:MAG TPA: Appr-1-p processing protein [Cyanobacteria bacterium UBA11149]|nr:Appr-1-p processing protein [Cyanobacteria bacterium UBA11367]HBE58761.1 Appr-1-p processing protein [Cyanobacteria bacterium UBA11366]HBK63728.1 Appr-1-p processing protein [Cyanobacteria bacterium UBA11166]HBR73255.1 Appr-1-p processing protein [Cyanobacteria bacterium UBA11159]HBS68810.1 Appr-1-p processing protein [Cyanobacteria bacterium UBA11153]HBW92440.1 Appr-1-p processing protein [Cyanobacteria bacterium UBA11149]HCA97485.1 Appr-1-p processing protein [Cyanobacteria bacterium UBA
MIEFKQGNLLEENVESLVNTVNCVGVMGKGIALQFKQAFPENFRQYEKACRIGEVKPGCMFTVPIGKVFYPRYIINFPTKNHWKGKSKLEDIKTGLKALVTEVQKLGITSIAIPPLGCGNGGLDWGTVKPLIESAFAELPEVKVVIFEPIGAPEVTRIQVATSKPKMTRSRSLLISLLELYGIPGYKLTLLEIQKLAYFLQVAGEPLKLRYVKHKYGPYADNLNHALQRIEGHYIRGYGDRSQDAEIYVLPEGREAGKRFLQQSPDANNCLEQVSRLIMGFETPYGMELLATVHWVAQENPEAAKDCEVAIALVHDWSDRKRNLFKPSHIRKAWQRLYQQNWL